ncbi:MAG: peroxiredoxin [Propionibacteriaceae bacterium]|nr:peroxiredoxin [Propionibacteriaceae bacterium]
MTRLKEKTVAPGFTLLDADGSPVSLSDFAGKKVILYFYPAAMTPGCTIEAIDFGKAFTELTDAGYVVIGISPDPPERLAAFRDKQGIAFNLLSDPTREVLEAYGAFGTKVLYGKTFEGVIRSTFVIDVDADGVGIIRLPLYNVRATGHVDRLLHGLGVISA